MSEPILHRMSRSAPLRRYFGKPFMAVNEWGWHHLPEALKNSALGLRYGGFLQTLVRLQVPRQQYHGTFFLRNRPELEMIRKLADRKSRGATLNLTVLACSNGAEVYSIVWTIRSARPDLNLVVHAQDISSEIVRVARNGVYSKSDEEMVGSKIFERLKDNEIETMFDQENSLMRIQPWLKEGIDWQVGDAGDPNLVAALGPQDIVVANKFLCHMSPPNAERCLRALSHLVAPGGYLCVSGIDLDVRTAVANDLGWTPLLESLEEIHDGDPSVRRDWPWRYWGLEPFDRSKQDWKVRYASIFQLGNPLTPSGHPSDLENSVAHSI